MERQCYRDEVIQTYIYKEMSGEEEAQFQQSVKRYRYR
eukprot:gene4102-2948_t